MNRAVFLDRDGVINWKAPEGEYITSKNGLILLPGVLGAVRQLRDAGFLIFIVTNQRGVARGRLSVEVLAGIHKYLSELFSAAMVPITEIYVCPHEGDCECRKPSPGMLLHAAEENSIDLRASWMVGDSLTDVEAGNRAGCRTVWIWEKTHELAPDNHPDLQAKDLPEAAELILKEERALLRERSQTKGMLWAE